MGFGRAVIRADRSVATRARRAIALSVLLVAVGCDAPAVPAGGAIRLRAAVLPYLVYAPFYVARDRGEFAAEGLDVEFVRVPTGAATLAALARGEVDVAAERPSVALLEALAAGERLAAVADLNHVDANGCVQGAILARPALAGDLSPRALVGRRVEMDRAGVESFLIDRVLAPLGRTSADVEAVSHDDPALGEAFANGAIDFAFTSEPWLSVLVRSGRAVVWRPFQQIAPDFQLGFVVFGPNLLDRRPEAGSRFVAAYLRAVAALAEGLDEPARARLAREFGLAPGELEDLCAAPVRRDGTIDGAGLAAFQQWALARGLLSRPSPLARFVEPGFAARFAARTAP